MAALLYPLFCFALLLFLHSTFWKDAWKSGMCLGTLVVALWPYISLYYVVICSIAHVLYVLWHFAIKYFNKEVQVSSFSTWNHGKSFFFSPVVSKLVSRIVLFYWYWYRLLNFWYRDTPTLIRVYCILGYWQQSKCINILLSVFNDRFSDRMYCAFCFPRACNNDNIGYKR